MDGGKTWTNVTGNITGVPKNTWTYFIEPSNFDKNAAFVVFDGHTQNDMKPYVLKTTDAGKTWKSVVNDQIPVFARSIKEDLKNPNLREKFNSSLSRKSIQVLRKKIGLEGQENFRKYQRIFNGMVVKWELERVCLTFLYTYMNNLILELLGSFQ